MQICISKKTYNASILYNWYPSRESSWKNFHQSKDAILKWSQAKHCENHTLHLALVKQWLPFAEHTQCIEGLGSSIRDVASKQGDLACKDSLKTLNSRYMGVVIKWFDAIGRGLFTSYLHAQNICFCFIGP